MILTIIFVALALLFAYFAVRVRSGSADRILLVYLAGPRRKLRRMHKARLCAFLWKIHAVLALAMVIGAFHGPLGSGAVWLALGLSLTAWALGVYAVNFRKIFRK